MTTVKEFKDLGVPFVDGDEGNHYKVGDEVSFNSCKIWDDSTPLSFAWRPLNTLPDNPKFKYEKSEFDSFWRPLLDQSKKSAYDVGAHVSGDKPVFTQEMADADETIKNGQQFKRVGFSVGTNKIFYIGAHPTESDLHIVWEVTNLDRYVASYALTMSSIAPLDTRTPKQKAVDAMLSDSRCSGSVIEVALERLYDTGYRKC